MEKDNIEESSEISRCYTCGICEIICDIDNLQIHDCVQGYSEIVTDDNLYFYPKDKDGNIVRRSLVNEVEQIVTESTLCSRSIPNNKESIRNANLRLEEQLIDEVRQRPPLWNFKLPLAERGIRIKERLWQEVAVELNSTLSVKEIKKKWKSLCDSFRTYCKKRKLPSGSATATSSSWVYYENMKFLLDVHLESQTTSNALHRVEDPTGEIEEIDNESCTNIGSPCSSDFSGSNTINKRRDNSECLQNIAEALMRPIHFDQPLQINVDVSRSVLEPEDSIKLFAKFIESELRKIENEVTQSEIMHCLFQMLHDAKRGQ